MSFDVPDCFAAVRDHMKKLGREVPTDVLRDISVKLAGKLMEGLSPNDISAFVTETYVDRLMRDAAAERAAKIINLQKAEQARSVVFQDGTNMNLVERLNGWITGGARKIGNATNLSVQMMEKGMATGWLRQIRSVLSEAGDLGTAESGLLGKEITQELADIERGGAGGVSGSEQAKRIAKVYNSVLAQAFEIKQAFDPFLGKIQDYFHRASHDQAKIEAVPREQWVEFAMSKYGQKSFPELAPGDKVEAFANIYDQIVKGTYGSSVNLDASTGDIMQKMAHSRTLIPNDEHAFYEYNQTFGSDNVHTSIIRALESAAHDVAVIQKFGSRPRATLNHVLAQVAESGSKDDIALLEKNRNRIIENFNAATQRSTSAPLGAKARFVRGFMGLQQLAKNSASILRSFDDLSNIATRMTDDFGGSYLSNMVEATGAYAKAFASDEKTRIQAMEDMYLYATSANHSLYEDYGQEAPITARGDKVEAGLNSLLELQSTLSLSRRHHYSVHAGLADVLARRLGLLSELSHEELPASAVQGLGRYGIGEHEWEALRQGTEDWSKTQGVEPAHGRMDRIMNADGIESIPDEVIAKYAKDSGAWKGEGEPPKPVLTRARSDLQVKLGAMVNDHAMAASATAGQAERTWMYGQNDADSWKGLALRMLWQFRSATIKNYDTVMRSYYSNPMRVEGDFSKVVRHAIMASSLYAAGYTAKTLLEGKTPENPASASFALHALASSGVGGIVGDTLLSEFARDGSVSGTSGAIAKGFAGPGLSTAFDVAATLKQLGYAAADSRTRFPGNDLGRIITQNVPFQNLFYTKAAFNYYFANGIREWMAPGYVAHMNKRVQQTPGLFGENQHYFMFNPTE